MNEIFMILAAALFLTLFIERPFLNLKKLIFDKQLKNGTEEQKSVAMKEI